MSCTSLPLSRRSRSVFEDLQLDKVELDLRSDSFLKDKDIRLLKEALFYSGIFLFLSPQTVSLSNGSSLGPAGGEVVGDKDEEEERVREGRRSSSSGITCGMADEDYDTDLDLEGYVACPI